MKNFEQLLQEELKKLPFEKGIDDGQYNDGQLAGFEAGAWWAIANNNSSLSFKYVLRILASPFVFGIVLIASVFFSLRRTILFLRYGGEWINYRKDERKTIYDIYNQLSK